MTVGTHQPGHGSERQRPEENRLVHTVEPSSRRHFLHHHVVGQGRVEKQPRQRSWHDAAGATVG